MTKLLKIITISVILLSFLNSCGIYRPVDSRKIPVNEAERVKKNIEEGRGIKILGNSNRGGDFLFASSNPMWRASLETLNFLPLLDYMLLQLKKFH